MTGYDGLMKSLMRTLSLSRMPILGLSKKGSRGEGVVAVS
jgi:hypothetical protein